MIEYGPSAIDERGTYHSIMNRAFHKCLVCGRIQRSTGDSQLGFDLGAHESWCQGAEHTVTAGINYSDKPSERRT